MEPNDKAIAAQHYAGHPIETERPTASAPPESFAPTTRAATPARAVQADEAIASPTPSGKPSSAASATKHKNNVRKIRIERMMSKAELARRANLSVLTIDRIEKGFGCRMDTKRKILEALGLSLDDRVRVFGEEE